MTHLDFAKPLVESRSAAARALAARPHLDGLGQFLKEQRRSAQLTLRQLADQAGVSNPYLSQIERGLRRPSAEVLQQLARALRISAETLYVRAGILDPVDADARSVEVAVLADPTLTAPHKRLLLDLYRSLRQPPAAAAGADHPDSAEPVENEQPETAATTTRSTGRTRR